MSAARSRLVLGLFLAIALGALTGVALGPKAAVLGELGTIVVRLLKALATPLVFLAIVDSFCKAYVPARRGALLLFLCIVNTTVAGSIAMGLSAMTRPFVHVNWASLESAAETATRAAAAAPSSPGAPGAAMPSASPTSPTSPTSMDVVGAIKGIFPESIGEPFVKNNVLAVVFLAILVGLALRVARRGGRGRVVEELVGDAFAIVTTLLGWVIEAVPVAVFGIIARVVGENGFRVFASLGVLVGTVTAGLAIQVFVFYSLLVGLVARRSPARFFAAAGEALFVALGTGSSMATLPVTLRTLESKLGVRPENARLAACVGTNFNHAGIMLYEVGAALFVAHAHGIHLGLDKEIAIALTSALAAAGIAGIPEAGLITLSLVLGSAALPLAGLPLLLTVDWLLGRMRAATNVASDLTVATLLERFSPIDGGAPLG